MVSSEEIDLLIKEYSNIISYDNENFKYYKEININDEIYYLNTNKSSAEKIKNLRKIIEFLNIDKNKIKLKFSDTD